MSDDQSHTESDDTTPDKAQQPTPARVVEIPDRVKYDPEQLTLFLTTVFHAPPVEGETVLTWDVRGRPGYPVGFNELLHKLRRVSTPRALYFGTSTCEANEDGELRNRQSLFKRLHVVVLDDVGTKVAVESLPEPLTEPSYIIETSEGNYQYGYVLDEPIDDLERAKALIQLVYDSGFTDAGGAMPTKLVRLPAGVNGKPGRESFLVRLVKLTERRWSPSELLSAVGCDTPWADIEKDVRTALRRPGAKSLTPWSPVALESPNLDGGIDPVLEWLYAEKLVEQETDEWVTIRCPWGHTHTTGDETAGYSPLGRGDDKHENRRGFHCFHEHCKERHTAEFLAWVAASDGPEVPIVDTSTRLAREWAFDPVDGLAYHIRGVRRIKAGIPLASMRSIHGRKVKVPGADGKLRLVNEVDLWLGSPSCVLVNGAMSDPSNPAPLVEFEHELRVNAFSQPCWGEGDWYEDDIEMFEGFVTYLIPDAKERAFFLDWLAAKMKDMSFRGPAILMVTPAQGTGRTTLAELIAVLLGGANCAEITFDKLTGSNTFNDWQLKPFVTTNETLDLGETKFYRAYERLKSLIEFQPTVVHINAKNRQARSLPVYTSYMLFSNHEAALSVAGNDRRIYVLSNPHIPATPEYFTRLYAWKNERDESGNPPWAPSVARWLRAREVDLSQLYKPVEATPTKQRMIEATRSPIDTAVDIVVENWRGPYILTRTVHRLLDRVAGRIDLNDSIRPARVIRRSLDRVSIAMNQNYKVRIGGRDTTAMRPRLLKRAVTEDPTLIEQCVNDTAVSPGAIAKFIRQNDEDELYLRLLEGLDLHDL